VSCCRILGRLTGIWTPSVRSFRWCLLQSIAVQRGCATPNRGGQI